MTTGKQILLPENTIAHAFQLCLHQNIRHLPFFSSSLLMALLKNRDIKAFILPSIPHENLFEKMVKSFGMQETGLLSLSSIDNLKSAYLGMQGLDIPGVRL